MGFFDAFKSKKKQTIEQELNTDILTQNITEQMSETSQKVSATGANSQTMVVKLEWVKGCSLNFGQKIDSETTSTGVMSAQTVNDMQQEVENDISGKLQAELEQTEGFLSLPADTQSDVKTKVNTSIKNITKKVFNVKNMQEVVARQTNIQSGELTIKHYECTPENQIDISQDIVSQVVAKSAMDAVINNIIKDKTLNKVANDIGAKGKQKSKGIGDAVSTAATGVGDGVGSAAAGIGDGIGNAAKGITGPMYASAAIVCIICVVVAAVALSPAGQKGITTAANVAKSKTGTF